MDPHRAAARAVVVLPGVLLVLALVSAGCASDRSTGPPAGPTAERPSLTAPPPTGSPAPSSPSSPGTLMPPDADPTGSLRRELLGMLARDQRGQSGGADREGPDARTARLAEIIDEHGWPTRSAVGKRAALAAWVVAQHSDLDLDFQERALALLELAVAEGEGSPGDLAYLTDRVAVAEGRPQTYGTQVGCTPTGPEPSTPIADEAGVEQRRREAGLDPLADYYAELERLCAADG